MSVSSLNLVRLGRAGIPSISPQTDKCPLSERYSHSRRPALSTVSEVTASLSSTGADAGLRLQMKYSSVSEACRCGLGNYIAIKKRLARAWHTRSDHPGPRVVKIVM